MTGIQIDLEVCIGCKLCVDACFVDVLRWQTIEKKPFAAYPQDCVWCLSCEIACPVQCIEVVPTIPVRIPPSY
jgi:NAD-dependent dihydropyrimidine dehydrogenase PreA subunit